MKEIRIQKEARECFVCPVCAYRHLTYDEAERCRDKQPEVPQFEVGDLVSFNCQDPGYASGRGFGIIKSIHFREPNHRQGLEYSISHNMGL